VNFIASYSFDDSALFFPGLKYVVFKPNLVDLLGFGFLGST